MTESATPIWWGQETQIKVILEHLRQQGWHITEHRINGTIEFHAVKLDGSEPAQIARCNDGDGPDEEYRAVCLLAEACGIDLEDG